MPAPLKVLIVEDVREDAALMERALTRHGFSATCERVDSLTQLTVALHNDPDVVLADYKVPNLELESVLTAAQSHWNRPPVIVVSGAVGEETAAATIRLGAADYVMKDRLQRLGPAVDRALAEAQLRRHERELEAELHLRNLAFASISDGMAITDPSRPNHPIIDCNPAFERITGYRRENILGRSLDFLYGSETDGTTSDSIRQAIASCQPFRGVLRHHRHDGTSFWNELTIQPLSDNQGHVVRFVTAIRDITVQREAEQKAAKHLAALAHFERLKSAGEMATGFAHELNQPLTAIVLQSETAAQLAAELTGPSQEKFLAAIDAIGKQAVRAADLIRVLRRLIKKSEASRSTLSIDQVVREAVKIMEHDFGQNHINVAFHSDRGLPTVLGDTIQLQQVMINLLRNAAESMREVSLEERQIVISCQATSRDNVPFVRVSVSDCGRGISEQDFARLFENFFTTKPQGMGLGLAICRSIVESHGGKIDCHPNATRGVTFELLLPVQRTT